MLPKPAAGTPAGRGGVESPDAATDGLGGALEGPAAVGEVLVPLVPDGGTCGLMERGGVAVLAIRPRRIGPNALYCPALDGET